MFEELFKINLMLTIIETQRFNFEEKNKIKDRNELYLSVVDELDLIRDYVKGRRFNEALVHLERTHVNVLTLHQKAFLVYLKLYHRVRLLFLLEVSDQLSDIIQDIEQATRLLRIIRSYEIDQYIKSYYDLTSLKSTDNDYLTQYQEMLERYLKNLAEVDQYLNLPNELLMNEESNN